MQFTQFLLKAKYVTDPRGALDSAFQQCDTAWLKQANRHGWDDGTTAVTALVHNKRLFVANAGDSRAVLACRDKGQDGNKLSYRAMDMSHDHKPNRQDEKRRVEMLQGRIVFYGTWRVEGVLAVTRAIGDRRLKKWVCPDPEIVQRDLEEGDDLLLLASDGVWDVLTSQAAVNVVRNFIEMNVREPAQDGEGGSSGGRNGALCEELLQQAAAAVVDSAYRQGSQDNITCVVVDLRAYR